MDGVQMTIYDFLSPPKPATELPCDKCLYDDMGCCWYDTKDDYCVMGDKAAYTLEDLDELTMVSRIAERTGLIFKKNTGTKLDHNLYEAKYKKAIIDVTYSRYDTLDELNGKRFIGVGYSFSKGGGGSPCDSLTKAVERIKGYQQTIDDMDKPKRKCCNNCNRYRMTVDTTTCEPRYMICHRPGTPYGDQITNPESYVCEFWEEREESE